MWSAFHGQAHTRVRPLPCFLQSSRGRNSRATWYVFGPSQIKSTSSSVIAQPFSPHFLSALLSTRLCIAYAGYNTLTDCLWAGVPTLLLIRALSETEQQQHAQYMAAAFPATFVPVAEASLTAETLELRLRTLLDADRTTVSPHILGGSEKAAHYLLEVLNS